MNANPVKVLHLIPTLSSGGAERQLANLVGSTSKNIINHTVCVIGEADFFSSSIREAGYEVIKLNITGKRPFIQAARKFRQVVRSVKPDIIHTWLYDAHIAARLACISDKKLPLVTSLQAPDYEPEIINIGNWSPRKVEVLKKIDKFTASLKKPYFVPCSHFVKKSYQNYYKIDEQKTQVIYNCVDPGLLTTSEAEKRDLLTRLSLSDDAFIFLNVSRLDPQKNHTVLIKAFDKVSKEIPDAYLILVGVGGLENELKSLVKNLQIEKKVLFLGRRNDIGTLLEIADVFVFPSLFEGLGVALIEAMFKSLPCIISKIEVFEEIIRNEETGLIIDENSAEELEEAMIKLYKDKDKRKLLGERALYQAQKKFDAKVTARQWEEFYLKVKAESQNVL